ncbi:MAG: hypothetical protein ACP5MC_02035 [Candidatus Micrarchaeia archaeon]
MADQPNAENQAVTTSIDDLVNYLSQHGETDSVTLARNLNVPENIIETWAGVLEKANIVSISYKAGKMYVSKAIATPQQEATIRQNVEEKRQSLANEVTLQLQDLEEINSTIEELKKYSQEVENAYKARAGDLKQVTDRLNAYEAEMQRLEKQIAEGKAYIEKFKGELSGDIASLNEKVKVLDSLASGAGASDAQALLQDINSKLNYGKQELASLRSSFDKQIDEARKQFIELSEGINKELSLLSNFTSQLNDQIVEYRSAMNSYSKESQELKRRINSEINKLTDESAKAAQQAEALYANAEKEVAALASSLADLKSKFPELTSFTETITSINKELEEASSERTALVYAFNELAKQLASIQNLGAGVTGKKVEQLQKAQEQIASTEKQVGALAKKVTSTSGKLKELGKKKKQ